MGFFIAVGKSFYVPPLVANYWRLLRGFRGAGGHCKFIFHVSGFRLQLGKKKKKKKKCWNREKVLDKREWPIMSI